MVQFLRFNQKNEVLQNKYARLAISEAMNKKAFVETLLNNGSRPVYGLIPEKFAFSSDEKDFRKENGRLVKDDVKTAEKNWTKAKQELGKDQVTLELLTSDNAVAKKNAEYLKGELEQNLEGLTVKIKAQPRQQQIKLLLNSDYDMAVDAWAPDIADPITFLNLFTTNSTYNFDKYSNEDYDKLVHEIKNDLASFVNAHWEAMKQAEKILLEDGALLFMK